MNFDEIVECVKLCLTKKYVQFEGRATRKEFWTYTLSLWLVSFVLNISARAFDSFFLAALCSLFGLAVLIPTLAVGVRRLHDTDRSGWYLLLTLIPLLGPIILLVFFCTDSKPDNQYGPNPKTTIH